MENRKRCTASISRNFVPKSVSGGLIIGMVERKRCENSLWNWRSRGLRVYDDRCRISLKRGVQKVHLRQNQYQKDNGQHPEQHHH